MSIRLLDETDKQELIEMIEDSGGSVVMTAKATGNIIHVTDAKVGAVKSLKLFNSSNTEISSAVNVAVTNKNLFRIDLIPSSSTNKGITFTKNADGSITANGTSTGTYASVICALDKYMFIPGQVFTISTGKTSGELYVQLIVNYTDNTTDYLVSRNSTTTFKVPKAVASVTGSVQITASGVTLNGETIFPQLELANTASSFANNEYTQISFTGSNLPTLPDSISNVWANDASVANIEMTYEVDITAMSRNVDDESKAIGDLEKWITETDETVSQLEENMPEIDATLTEEGKAADAKATGDALSGKANTSHTHDDRYYTESEMNTLLNGKSDTSHTHDSRYYTESEIDTKLSGKANSSHTHDDRYYTESEIDTKVAKLVGFPNYGGKATAYYWVKLADLPGNKKTLNAPASGWYYFVVAWGNIYQQNMTISVDGTDITKSIYDNTLIDDSGVGIYSGLFPVKSGSAIAITDNASSTSAVFVSLYYFPLV